MKTARLPPVHFELSAGGSPSALRDLPAAIDSLCAADDARVLRGKEPHSVAARRRVLEHVAGARDSCRTLLAVIDGLKADSVACRVRANDGALSRGPLSVSTHLMLARKRLSEVLSVLDDEAAAAARVRAGFDALQQAGSALVMTLHPVVIDCLALAKGRREDDSLVQPGTKMAQAHAAPLATLAALADTLDRVARAIAPLEIDADA